MMGAQRWLSTAVAPHHRCKGLGLLLGSLTAQWWCTPRPGGAFRQLRVASATSQRPAVGLQPSACHTSPTLPDTCVSAKQAAGTCSCPYTLSTPPSPCWCS